ncbi:MAG TPA: molybdenum cofactor biosynthesis protein MoaE [Gemmatimonadaceae bacterium]
MRAALVTAPIDAAGLLAEVSSPRNGAAVLFVGTVREVNEGRAVDALDYAAYEAMAQGELERIAADASARFGVADLAVEHRIGLLGLGEVSVAIAVAHPHRGAAFDACRWVIEAIKARVPIWKREHYADGERSWVHPAGQGEGSPR